MFDGQVVVLEVLLVLLRVRDLVVQLLRHARLVAAVGVGEAGDGLVGRVAHHQRCLAELREDGRDDGSLLAHHRRQNVIRCELGVGARLRVVDRRGERLLGLVSPLLRIERHHHILSLDRMCRHPVTQQS